MLICFIIRNIVIVGLLLLRVVCVGYDGLFGFVSLECIVCLLCCHAVLTFNAFVWIDDVVGVRLVGVADCFGV